MVFESIQEIIASKLDIAPEEITLESSFVDMQVDSLYMVEIMLAIEEEFSIMIDEAAGMENVGDLVQYVEKKIK
ncbi:MAG: acyl carrier protein [Firmicutes bacterium]|nr:acyl carrier protein [Bacillota bacterium]